MKKKILTHYRATISGKMFKYRSKSEWERDRKKFGISRGTNFYSFKTKGKKVFL